MIKKGSKRRPPLIKVQNDQLKIQDTSAWLTRYQASDLLRCSPQTLKNYVNRGMLHPLVALRRDFSGNERSMLVFNPTELAELPTRNGEGRPRNAVREPGEQAARAFELFREGCSLDEVVIELRVTPDRVDQLHEHWLDQTSARYVITKEAKTHLEQIVGAFGSVTELIELITRRLKPA